MWCTTFSLLSGVIPTVASCVTFLSSKRVKFIIFCYVIFHLHPDHFNRIEVTVIWRETDNFMSVLLGYLVVTYVGKCGLLTLISSNNSCFLIFRLTSVFLAVSHSMISSFFCCLNRYFISDNWMIFGIVHNDCRGIIQIFLDNNNVMQYPTFVKSSHNTLGYLLKLTFLCIQIILLQHFV